MPEVGRGARYILCNWTANKRARWPSEKIQNMISRTRYFSQSTAAFLFENIRYLLSGFGIIQNYHMTLIKDKTLSQSIVWADYWRYLLKFMWVKLKSESRAKPDHFLSFLPLSSASNESQRDKNPFCSFISPAASAETIWNPFRATQQALARSFAHPAQAEAEYFMTMSSLFLLWLAVNYPLFTACMPNNIYIVALICRASISLCARH